MPKEAGANSWLPAREALAGTAEVGPVGHGATWPVARGESGEGRTPSPIDFYFARLWSFERPDPLIFPVGGRRHYRAFTIIADQATLVP
jgi:hypothetical protein